MKTVTDAALPDDASLIAICLKGDRDAFGSLVKRYQSLVCALIYSRCGDVGQSEDLAQETFLAAWKSLPSLQHGGNFKGWLCQIARNVSASAVRREAGKPHGHSSRIEDAPELVDGKNSPASEAISREEEEVVWRTLETLPENYRLPLILFHREGESIAAVAAALDLSEDAVKQRLARGREMLKQEVNSVIEGTLRRTNPGAQFTAAAIAGIGGFGAATAKAAGLGTVATSAVAAKTLVGAGIFWMGVVPIISEWLTYFIITKQTRTREERSIFKRYAIYGLVATVAFTACLIASRHLNWGQQGTIRVTLLVISSVCFCGVRWTLAFLAVRKAGWLGPAVKGEDGRKYRTGCAPGWQVRCPKCGLTVDAGAAGLVRIGAVGTHMRRIGRCSLCEAFRWLILERTKK